VSNIGDDDRPKTAVTDFRSMSKVSVGQILGLVEAVDEVGGVADAATLSREVDMDVDRLGPILNAAEFLGLVTVEDGDIRITDLSRKLLMASVRERKKIVREIIDDLPAFRLVMDMARSAGAPLGRQEVLQALADRVGSHHAEDVFTALVYWGRYAELVRYDSESEQLTLRTMST
jgi:NitT/TauT family transport system ATP-binding protein